MNRRRFVVAAGAAVCAGVCGCQGGGSAATAWTGPTRFELGRPESIPPGVDGRWAKSGGFFLVREGRRIFAVSAICTHRECPLVVEGYEFDCTCHGSSFTREGEVLTGPATRSLPRFGISRGADGGIVVDRTTVYEPARWGEAGAFVAV